jgi:hypothetical protein
MGRCNRMLVLSVMIIFAMFYIKDTHAGLSSGTARISPEALELLVSGIAFYPDPLVEQILAATTTPGALLAAAHPERHGPLARRFQAHQPEAVSALLATSPETVAVLAAHPGQLILLGAIEKRNPKAIRAAIAKLRAEAESLGANNPNATAGSAAGNTAPSTGTNNTAPIVLIDHLLATGATVELQTLTESATNTGTLIVVPTEATTAGTAVTVTPTTVTTANGTAQGVVVTGSNGTAVAGTGSSSTTYTTPGGETVTVNRAQWAIPPSPERPGAEPSPPRPASP